MPRGTEGPLCDGVPVVDTELENLFRPRNHLGGIDRAVLPDAQISASPTAHLVHACGCANTPFDRQYESFLIAGRARQQVGARLLFLATFRGMPMANAEG